MARRRGAYAVLFSLLVVVLAGFGALAVDASILRLAHMQCQDVTDAAAHAGVLALKRTGSAAEAEAAAIRVLEHNPVLGRPLTLGTVTVGEWDEDTARFTPTTAGGGMNAVRLRAGHTGDDAVPLWFAPLIGHPTANVEASATAATRSLEVVLVLDITGSWHQKDFAKARAAAIRFLDVLHENHGPDDVVGMTIFFNRYGWEYTPFTNVAASAASDALVRDKWAQLNVGSYAGDYQSSWTTGSNLTSKHVPCKVYATTGNGALPFNGWTCTSGSSCYQPTRKNNFTYSKPAGGCFPTMPRYYSDEAGTDHTTGMEMARTMFAERFNPSAYRAMVVLTDGEPYGYSGGTTLRSTAGHDETRYRQYKRSAGHTTSQIRHDTVALAADMRDDLRVNTWFVSFVEYDSFMFDAATGDGWFELARKADDIEPIFEYIARSLPATVVE